jgi:hypothetical protein
MANWKEFLEGSSRDVIKRFSRRNEVKPQKPPLMVADSSAENAFEYDCNASTSTLPIPWECMLVISMILELGPHFLPIWRRFCGHRPVQVKHLTFGSRMSEREKSQRMPTAWYISFLLRCYPVPEQCSLAWVFWQYILTYSRS